MPSKKRTASQARKDRAALKRLQKSGIYKGKIDLRKAPSSYQLKKIEQLKATRKRAPMPPKPSAPGATIKRKRVSKKELLQEGPKGGHTLVTYALPFLRKGKAEPEWRRFTRSQLTKFLNEYKEDAEERAEWRSYAVREEWHFVTKGERTEFKGETDLYFSGRRISEPHGKIRKVHANQHTKKARAKRRAKKKG